MRAVYAALTRRLSAESDLAKASYRTVVAMERIKAGMVVAVPEA